MSRRVATPGDAPHPRYVVFELTLRCDLHCHHCGSRAGLPRTGELTRLEALDVIRQLAELGTQEIAFIGGEAYLVPWWLDAIRACVDHGIRPVMTTGARQLDDRRVREAKHAGLAGVSVSIDGLEATHDRLRNVAGSWRAATDALTRVAEAGLRPYANTQFNRLNLPEIEPLAALLAAKGVTVWQVQVTGPMGRAAEMDDWLLQPWQILELVDRLSAVARADTLHVEAANNLGYFGPHEQHLRRFHWQGCKAGTYVLGVESNGDVKGCPSLPSAPYVGGNVRNHPLAELWQDKLIGFTRDRDRSELWGRCASCYYADECLAGCSWTAHTLLGRRGNLPYCYHRAEQLQREGLREELLRVEAPPGQAFDFGRFELVEVAISDR